MSIANQLLLITNKTIISRYSLLSCLHSQTKVSVAIQYAKYLKIYIEKDLKIHLLYLQVLLKKAKLKNRFYLLGYESGVLVALEMAAILEDQGIIFDLNK